MQRVKSSSQSVCSSNKPLSVTTTFKYDKVQKLNTIVREIADTARQQEIQQPLNTAKTSQPREIKTGVSQKVLDLIKNKIKTNYEHLYQNYNQNKTKILKQIQTVQTNVMGQNAINSKFDDVVKQKARYDKLKSQVQEKQKKLKKLMDTCEMMKLQTNSNLQDQQSKSKEEIIEKLQKLEIKKQELQHQTMILNRMLAERKEIKLNLKERYENMQEELNIKKEKAQKFQKINFNKKNMLLQIEEKLEAQDNVEIPQKLAEELSNKLEEYENKQSYNNIIQHQSILQEKRLEQLQRQIKSQKEKQRISKIRKEAQQKSQYEQYNNLYLIKHYEEEKIKKLCGVETIQEIADGHLKHDEQNLQKVRSEIEQEIFQVKSENSLLQKQIEELLKLQKQYTSSTPQNVYKLQKRSQNEAIELSRMKEELHKKQSLVNEWLTIAHMINKENINDSNSWKSIVSSAEKSYMKLICSNQVYQDEFLEEDEGFKKLKFRKVCDESERKEDSEI